MQERQEEKEKDGRDADHDKMEKRRIYRCLVTPLPFTLLNNVLSDLTIIQNNGR